MTGHCDGDDEAADGTFASPPCFMHELDPAYFGGPVESKPKPAPPGAVADLTDRLGNDALSGPPGADPARPGAERDRLSGR